MTKEGCLYGQLGFLKYQCWLIVSISRHFLLDIGDHRMPALSYLTLCYEVLLKA